MLSPDQQLRYQKHLNLPEMGEAGQLRLQNAKVLVVGAGGLGCPVLLYLSAAGVGTIGLIDPDVVDLSNLQRQVLYETQDVGKPKVTVAVERLNALNPTLTYRPYVEALNAQNANTIIADYDLVVDCTDNFAVRYAVNDACVRLGKPFVYGAIHRYEGQVAVLNAKLETPTEPTGRGPTGRGPTERGSTERGPTYRCLFPNEPGPAEIPNCAETGVLGVLPGLIGVLQAAEAIKLITGIGQPLTSQLLLIDVLTMEQRKIRIRRRADAEQLANANAYTSGSLTVEVLAERLSDVWLLDVREPYEVAICQLPNANLIPMREIPARIGELPTDKPIVAYCHHGMRSGEVVRYLQQQGIRHVQNLEGGIDAWARRIDPAMPRY